MNAFAYHKLNIDDEMTNKTEIQLLPEPQTISSRRLLILGKSTDFHDHLCTDI